MSTRFYTYKLIDPKTNLPFYIGKGTKDRMFDHVNLHDKQYKNMSHNNGLLKNKTKKVLRESGHIKYQRYLCSSEQQAFDIEKKLIAKYGRRDIKTGILCNMTNGGEGVSGAIRDEQWREKQRAARANHGSFVDRYTMEGQYIDTWKAKEAVKHLNIDSGSLSLCYNNKARSAGGFRWTKEGVPLIDWETIRKERDKHKPHKPHKIHKHTKTVYQFTFEGEYIQSFMGCRKAGEHINKSENAIRECCRKRSTHAGGYLWRFDKDDITKPALNVFQYDSSGKFIKGYVNILSAHTQTNISKTCITQSLNREETVIGNQYYWREYYVDQLKLRSRKTSGKKVYQYTKDYHLVNTFPSAKQAMEQTGLIGISNVLSGVSKTAGGYVFSHIPPEEI